MNSELVAAIKMLEEEKGIPKQTLLSAIEQSLLQACKTNFGKNDNINVSIDPDTCEYTVTAEMEVVDDVMLPKRKQEASRSTSVPIWSPSRGRRSPSSIRRDMTSFDVIYRLRKIFDQQKMGHTGTLDPEAEGVLPVCMFTRGQTQICDCVTLAPLSEAQKIEGLDPYITKARYMHQYNFPSYSVGETKPSRGPGRREIGHGALAERALIPVLPSEEEFPYAIRAVSETFESNGSTSQASICASSMALMAAGVPIKKPVAGISCGLVTGDTDDNYIVLTDIQGLEDFFGDMDFKVAGTHELQK